MKKPFIVVMFFFAGIGFVNGQKPIRAGMFAGYGTKVEKPAVGVIGEIGIMENLTVSPSFAYYFLERSEYIKAGFWEINANANYYFLTESSFSVYGLAGLQIAGSTVKADLGGFGFGGYGGSSTKVGLNIGGGANLELGGKILPFAELKYTLGGAEQLGISVGIKYSIR